MRRLIASVRASSQRHGVTVFMSLLAAWGLLLARMAGQDEVVVGTPVANRQRAELEPLVGFFVNTLALRLSRSADLRVADWLQHVKTACLGAYAHQDVPFEQVVEAVRPARSLGHSPLFQAMLALDNTPRREIALPGLTLSALPTPRATTQFDLSLSLTESADGIEGYLEYASDLFDRATIERLAGHFETLLAAMAQHDDMPVDRLPLLTPAQRAQLLHDFNATAVDARPNNSSTASSKPGRRHARAIALVHDDHTLTYAELNARANRVAHRLIALGVQPDDRVALCVERGLDMVVGLLACLKSGAAYVPLDPAYPPPAARLHARGQRARGLLTQAPLRETLATALPTSCSTTGRRADRRRRQPRAARLRAHHLAYVIYTSGSTGRPKA
jgi:non-ribosomal peptide synthetase component F